MTGTPVDVRAAYDVWADTYPPWAHNPLMAAEERAVRRRLRRVRAARALDVGTGSGRCLPLLAATGASVTGLDWSAAMLRRHVSGPRVRGDARALPFADAAFDLVHASLVAGDIADLRAWLAELARVTTPGGLVLYSDFDPGWAARGWQRSFVAADGRALTLPLHRHTVDDHHAAARACGLEGVTLDAIRVAVAPRRPWRRPVAALLIASRKKGS